VARVSTNTLAIGVGLVPGTSTATVTSLAIDVSRATGYSTVIMTVENKAVTGLMGNHVNATTGRNPDSMTNEPISETTTEDAPRTTTRTEAMIDLATTKQS
jgi:hypothetical protein